MPVDEDDVRSIAEFEMVSDDDLEVFIDDAEGYVSDLTPLDDNDRYSENTFERVVKWVAAHLASMKQKRVSEESFTDASMKFEGETGMMLKFTRYGQQAIVLDPSNTLGAKRRYSTATHSEPDYEPLDNPGYPGEHYR